MQNQLQPDSVESLLARLDAAEAAKQSTLDPLGKLSARRRLASLFDEGSFTELGAFIKRNAEAEDADFEGVVAGYGAVDGRLVYAFSQDFSVMNGAVGAAQLQKILTLYEMAEKNPAPIVAMLDSNGAKLNEGVFDALYGFGKVIKCAALYRGVAPQLALVMGVCGGSAAIYAASCDFVLMESDNGRLFVTPPSVIRALGSECADFGTSDACLRDGTASLAAKGESDVIELSRRLLSYLPMRCGKGPFYTESPDDINRSAVGFGEDVLDLDASLLSLADDGRILHLYATETLSVSLLTLGSQTVGVLATDIQGNDGYLSPVDLKVAARFTQTLNTIGLPLLVLVDTKGFDASAEADGKVLITSAAELGAAFAAFTPPLVSVVIGQAWGASFPLLGSKAIGADLAFALENTVISVMDPVSAVEFLWNDRIAALEDPLKEREGLVTKWKQTAASPFAVAYDGKIDAVIRPFELRQRLIAAFDMLSSKL